MGYDFIMIFQISVNVFKFYVATCIAPEVVEVLHGINLGVD